MEEEFLKSELNIDGSEKRMTVAERILAEMQVEQHQSLVTDLFALMALVMRKRVGKIQAMADTAWDDIMRQKETQTFLFSMVGVLCNIVIASIFWYSGEVVDGDKRIDQPMRLGEIRQDIGKVRGALLVCSQVIMTISTFVTMVLIMQRYRLVMTQKRRQWSGIETYDLVQSAENEERLSKFKMAYSFWRSRFRYTMFAELLVQLCHPLIWMYTEGSGRDSYEILSVLIFARLYLTVNLVFTYSDEYRLRHEIIASNQELQRTGYQITVGSVMRMLFFRSPAKVTLYLLVGSLVSLGFIMFVVERNNQPEIASFGSLTNCFWFTFVTFTTVGYGDMAPKSQFGRLVAFTIGAMGITITTIFGGVVTNLMGQSREQRSVSEYLANVDAVVKVRTSAARAIQAAWRYSRSKSGDISLLNLKTGHKSNMVYGEIKKFKRHMWELHQSLSTASDPVIDDQMNNVTYLLRGAVESVEKHAKTYRPRLQTYESFVFDIGKVIDNRYNNQAGSPGAGSPN